MRRKLWLRPEYPNTSFFPKDIGLQQRIRTLYRTAPGASNVDQADILERDLIAFIKKNQKLVNDYVERAATNDLLKDRTIKILRDLKRAENKNKGATPPIRSSKVSAKKVRPQKTKTTKPQASVTAPPIPKIQYHYNRFFKVIARGERNHSELLKIVHGNESALKRNFVKLAMTSPVLFKKVQTDSYHGCDLGAIEAETMAATRAKKALEAERRSVAQKKKTPAPIQKKHSHPPTKTPLQRLVSIANSGGSLTNLFTVTTSPEKLKHLLNELLKHDEAAFLKLLNHGSVETLPGNLRHYFKSMEKKVSRPKDLANEEINFGNGIRVHFLYTSVDYAKRLIEEGKSIRQLKKVFVNVGILAHTLIIIAQKHPDVFSTLCEREHPKSRMVRSIRQELHHQQQRLAYAA